MVPFTHLALQSLQSFSKVFRVLFSAKTEAAFETDRYNNTDTDSQNEFKAINFHRGNCNKNNVVTAAISSPGSKTPLAWI